MNEIAIKFENVSKQYRLGSIGTGTLSHDLKRWWAVNMLRKEDPYLKIGSVNKRDSKRESEYVWALKDINLRVRCGEVLGIIGKNGAGKSTLLKILSRVTSPSTGQILANGRIASLLEVGTGFHPEMTGRENIFMNGSIMGMKKIEIRRKLEEIIDFAGVEMYIDTPVKRYSSGMIVRLGFAIAAHLEPEILIVDEVLSVGDADFQKKALGKMQDVSRANGRTVLFVSHNMNAIKSLCEQTVILNSGTITNIGSTDKMIIEYLGTDSRLKRSIDFKDVYYGDNICKLINARLLDDNMSNIDHQEISRDLRIVFSFRVLRKTFGIPNMHLFTIEGTHILFSAGNQSEYLEGDYLTTMIIPGSLLNTGTYVAGIAFTSLKPYTINFYLKDALTFEIIEDMKGRMFDFVGNIPGIVRPKFSWETKII